MLQVSKHTQSQSDFGVGLVVYFEAYLLINLYVC